ncbi:S8 family serine peptidase [Halobaculum sp. MBLA0143]|uniref:S8 family peptidase n=1 Tax=Halobaculum sp. MBLA0143 TaxID=3079933 RepID=UPI0035261DD1
MSDRQLGGVNGPSGNFSTRSVSMETSDDRFIVSVDDDPDADTVSMGEMSGSNYTIVHDLSEEIGYVVVQGDESWMPAEAEFVRDRVIQIDDPVTQLSPDEVAKPDGLDPQSIQQWDKLEQNAGQIPADAGSGARIGIVDSGVIGAKAGDGVPEHPDLPRGSKVLTGSGEPNDDGVFEGPSYNFTGDGTGPGPVTDPHGTECAGTAAAADNGTGVAGIAPGAEIVDLRVFPAEGGAATGDILAAMVAGATPRDETVNVTVGEVVDDSMPREVRGSGCDVLNLSLGLPPLVPIPEGPLPSLPSPLIAVPLRTIAFFGGMYTSAAQYALSEGTLPIASAGNSGVGLGIPLSDDRQVPRLQDPEIDAAPVTFPANAEGFVSVGATGPIGYGWSADGDGVFFQTELPEYEPAQYSNYGTSDPTIAGGTAVDVTAGGGNFDSGAFASIDAIEAGDPIFDLLYTTAFTGDRRGGSLSPNFTFTAGTSFSAPNVAGLAALLYGFGDDPTPEAVRTTIEESAEQLPVGRAGQTAAASVGTPNAATDSVFDGDSPSAPGRVSGRLDPADHRGNGHIDVLAAIEPFLQG